MVRIWNKLWPVQGSAAQLEQAKQKFRDKPERLFHPPFRRARLAGPSCGAAAGECAELLRLAGCWAGMLVREAAAAPIARA